VQLVGRAGSALEDRHPVRPCAHDGVGVEGGQQGLQPEVLALGHHEGHVAAGQHPEVRHHRIQVVGGPHQHQAALGPEAAGHGLDPLGQLGVGQLPGRAGEGQPVAVVAQSLHEPDRGVAHAVQKGHRRNASRGTYQRGSGAGPAQALQATA
jgi:hypothetical protein